MSPSWKQGPGKIFPGTGWVVAVSMPMSFLMTFAGMKLFRLQIDMVTLTAIILAVGMVVDASVVVLENISRKYTEEHLPPLPAAIEGAKEIQFSVIAGNTTTILVLVPLLFLYGFTGKTFGPLAATLIIAFVSSLFVALALVPLLTLLVIGKGGKMEKFAKTLSRPWEWLMEKTRRFYIFTLKAALRNRAPVFIAAILLFIAGVFLLRSLGIEMLPQMDGGASFVTVETPSGSSLEDTEKMMARVEQTILEEPEAIPVSTQIGFEPGMRSFGGWGVQGPTRGYTTISWSPRAEREDRIWEIQDRLRSRLEEIPNIRNFVVKESGSTAKATTPSTLTVRIKGDDPLVLNKLGDTVLDIIASVPGTVNPYRNWRLDQRIIGLDFDEERARELGISPRSLARELSQTLDGMAAGIFRGEGGENTPIRVRYAEQFRRYEQDVYESRIFSPREGKALPAGTLVTGYEETARGLVTRENLQPSLDILALQKGGP
jgi:multidrug efflux pump subunit AcrB